jgi:two-component system KDP operon response regulator KdpE
MSLAQAKPRPPGDVAATLPLILVVEDDPQIRRVLGTSLAAHGFGVQTAGSAREAREMAARLQPDLIVLDLGLPDGDGMDLIGVLRSRPTQEILVLSARASEELKVRALDLGADDFLAKPFGLPELLARVRVALRRGRQESDPQGRIELPAIGVTIDVQRHQVTRNGREVHLTPIEFRLMATLARHGGKILTHEQLLAEVWGEGQEENKHYLRIYLGVLRRKLEADPARPKILLTVPGVGYRLATEAAE